MDIAILGLPASIGNNPGQEIITTGELVARDVFVQWGKGLAVPDKTGEMRIANGVAMIDSSELDDQTAAAIAEVAQTRDGIKIKFHDKRAALMDIGRHLGMFKERVEMTGKDSGPLQVETSMTDVAKLLLLMLHDSKPGREN